MLREIRLDMILLVVVTVIIALVVLNATAEVGPLKTGEFGVPPDWDASTQDLPAIEMTPEVISEATEEATDQATEEPES